VSIVRLSSFANQVQKLQPFFPPLEPLQSLNLRAALFRMLSELKKSGVLGRETVLRKTMLDECKGDKFTEVLVIFSSAVVKQVMLRKNTGQYQRPPVSMALASSALRSPRDRAALVPLTLAHRGAIANFLRLKSETHNRCQSFSQLLDQKTDQLKYRMGQCHASENDGPPEQVRRRIEREVVENWPGSNKWPQALLYGDHKDPGDDPLRRPFDDVWDVVANGGALLSDTATLGLIENLERRVNEQKERLVKWRDFHELFLQRLRAQGPEQPALPEAAKPSFEFLKHQGLDLNSAESASPVPILESRNALLDEIIKDMKAELHSVSVPKVKRRTEAKHEAARTVAASTAGTQEPPRDAARPARTRQQPLFKARLLSANVSGMYKPGGNSMAYGQIFSPAKAQPAPKPKPAEVPSFLLSAPVNGHKTNPEPSVNQVSNGHDSYLQNGYNGSDMVQPLSNAESLTLLSSRMSLTDRTRMTMGQTSANLQPTGAVQATNEAFSATSVIAAGPSVADRRASLLERTQQSMLASAPRAGSRMSLAVKKNRQSILYPVNQFETPGRPRAEPIRNATPTETLFSADADYASVFKSRPRVKLSPVGTPAEDELPSPASQGTVYDIDETLDDDDSWMRSSPLRGKG
jgi:hypothetical protein